MMVNKKGGERTERRKEIKYYEMCLWCTSIKRMFPKTNKLRSYFNIYSTYSFSRRNGMYTIECIFSAMNFLLFFIVELSKNEQKYLKSR